MTGYFHMLFFGKERFLAVDIGTTSIKVGEFEIGRRGPELLNYSIAETFGHLTGTAQALQTSSFRFLDPAVADYLKSLLKKMRAKTNRVVVALPAFSAFTTIIELPKMTIEDTARAMTFEARQYVPAPLSTVKVEWFPVGERVDESGNSFQQIFLISIANAFIEKYEAVLWAAKMNITHFELENISLARALTSGVPEPTIIVDIGSRSTSFSVAENGILKFASQTDFAGSSLTQVLAASLNITLFRAETIKIQKGIVGEGGEAGLSTLIMPLLDAIINEARRAIDGFERHYGRKVARVILSGGTAKLIGVIPYMKKQIGLSVELARPFDRISYPALLKDSAADLGPRFAVMIGLALKNP